MMRESERNYVMGSELIDVPNHWNGAAYTFGLDGEADESVMITTPSGGSTSWADAFKSALPVLASVYQQRQLTQLNVARINRNQPPLTAQEYAIQYQPPAAQVQVGATQDMKRLMLYGAIGLAALVGLRAAKVI